MILLTQRFHDRFETYNSSALRRRLYEDVANIFHARCSFQMIHEPQHPLPTSQASIADPNRQSSNILEMLARARVLQAADSRDKIFALMGISSGLDTIDQRITIDYKKSTEEVFVDFAAYMIDVGKSYDILSHADNTPVDGGSYGTLKRFHALHHGCLIGVENCFNADNSGHINSRRYGKVRQGLRGKAVEQNHDWSNKTHALRCRGSIIDVVKATHLPDIGGPISFQEILEEQAFNSMGTNENILRICENQFLQISSDQVETRQRKSIAGPSI